MKTATKGPLFPFGQIVATPGEFLARNGSGEWGELDEHDRKENQLSLEHGFRILSVYRTLADARLWVITEADRSVTTILLPQEY